MRESFHQRFLLSVASSLFLGVCLPVFLQAESPESETIELALERAQNNRPEIEKALSTLSGEPREAMEFLVTNMPSRDLQALSSEFLVEHVRLAYEAKEKANWGSKISKAVFLNDLLPYAVIDEARDSVRQELRDRFWPQVAHLNTSSQAAAKLNQVIFQKLNVKYSTKRRAANQGPKETMASGLASCTGLSILLIDACRACGIPARFVGVPMWSNNSGNHSWVEIWDEDTWHFTGAAEPTGDALDRGWFVDRAAQQKVGSRRYGIFAVSFKRTPQTFPSAWSKYRTADNEVYCVEVTQRYQRASQSLPEGFVAVAFKSLTPSGFDRCRADLLVRDLEGNVVFEGQTHDDSFDQNDHLTAKLKEGKYEVELRTANGSIRKEIQAEQRDTPITLRLEASNNHDDSDTSSQKPVQELKEALADPSCDLQNLSQQAFARQALDEQEARQAEQLLTEFYFSKIRTERRKEHESKSIQLEDLEMKFDFTVFGDAPAEGRSLYISMHGGGNAPPAVNDRQWENQKRLYRLEEGIYVAPRAPTNTWNLWHQAHIDLFFTRLIENMILFENVDPNRVYVTGYSAGGDGVFQLAPRMADQLAGAAMMAGHPNETKPDGLRNLPFTLHMGANDGAYDRNKKASEWKDMFAKLKADDPQGYTHWVEVHDGKGHWMDRQDAKGVAWLAQFRRTRAPDRVVWLQDDVTHSRFYWLAVPEEYKQARSRIVARRDGNKFYIEESTVPQFHFLLDDEWQDLDAPIEVYFQEERIFQGHAKRTIADIVTTLTDRGDPLMVFNAHIEIEVPSPKDKEHSSALSSP